MIAGDQAEMKRLFEMVNCIDLSMIERILIKRRYISLNFDQFDPQIHIVISIMVMISSYDF